MARAVLGTLAGILFLRVLGVSLLLAGFLEHALSLGATPFQAGLAFGAYPLALAALLLPLGHASDRWGRRPVLAGGLLVAGLGGVVAAFAPNVLLLTVGRFLSGAGAVNGVALAVAGETGDPATRTGRMAVLGAAAGGGFAVGVVLGALLLPLVGIPGLLLGHGLLTLAMAPLALRVVPPETPRGEARPRLGGRPDGPVLLLGLAAFGVNLSMTGLLLVSPALLQEAAPQAPYALLVTAMVLPAGLGMFLTARLADRGWALPVGIGSAAALALGPLAFVGHGSLPLLLAAGVAYFLAHASLASLLPSLTASLARTGARGAAQGVQSTLQYLGSFAGSLLAPILLPWDAALGAAFVLAALLVAAALATAVRLPGVTHAPPVVSHPEP